MIKGIDIADIVELVSSVAPSGAIRAAELVADDIFEYTITIAVLIYESGSAWV